MASADQYKAVARINGVDNRRPGLHSDIKVEPHITTLPEYNGKEVPELREYKGSGKLAGKGALITGGDSGIGRAVAVLFAREGADVAINYLPGEQSDAEEVKKAVEKEGRKCVLIPHDIRGEENCKKIVEEAKKGLGEFQILINNAGTQMEQPSLLEISAEQLQDTFNTNIFSMFYITKACLPHLKRGASIVNCASINHYIGHPKLLDYTSTKGAIVAFTRSIAGALAEKGIRANLVAPGPIVTPLVFATMSHDSLKKFGVTTPLERAGQPSEVATCFVFLASSDSSYISGNVLHPNGGVVIN